MGAGGRLGDGREGGGGERGRGGCVHKWEVCGKSGAEDRGAAAGEVRRAGVGRRSGRGRGEDVGRVDKGSGDHENANVLGAVWREDLPEDRF